MHSIVMNNTTMFSNTDPYNINNSETQELSNISSGTSQFWSRSSWTEEDSRIVGQFLQTIWSCEVFSVTDVINNHYEDNWSDDRDALTQSTEASHQYVERVAMMKKQEMEEAERKLMSDQAYNMLYLQQNLKSFPYYYQSRSRSYGGY